MSNLRDKDSMLSASEARDVIDAVFEETALILGGLFTLGDVDDDAVWQLIPSLDAIRGRAIRRLEEKARANGDRPSCKLNLKPHPAITDFLDGLRRTP
jgi:hypothetical protein